MEENLKQPNVASQIGLAEMFDASIGKSTVLMPFGGKYQLTETEGSVQKLPVFGFTNTCSIMTHGYHPELSLYSPYPVSYTHLIVVLPPSRQSRGVVLELKVASAAAALKPMAEKACEQIKKQKYIEGLYADGYEDIIGYGIAFYKKSCVIIALKDRNR